MAHMLWHRDAQWTPGHRHANSQEQLCSYCLFNILGTLCNSNFFLDCQIELWVLRLLTKTVVRVNVAFKKSKLLHQLLSQTTFFWNLIFMTICCSHVVLHIHSVYNYFHLKQSGNLNPSLALVVGGNMETGETGREGGRRGGEKR